MFEIGLSIVGQRRYNQERIDHRQERLAVRVRHAPRVVGDEQPILEERDAPERRRSVDRGQAHGLSSNGWDAGSSRKHRAI